VGKAVLAVLAQAGLQVVVRVGCCITRTTVSDFKIEHFSIAALEQLVSALSPAHMPSASV
jgi:hypothetical protein